MKLIIKQAGKQESKIAVQQANTVAPQNAKIAEQATGNEAKATTASFQLKIPGRAPAQIGAIPTNTIQEAVSKKSDEHLTINVIKENKQSGVSAISGTNQATGIQYPGQPSSIDPKLLEEFQQTKNILHNCLVESKDMIGYALRRVMTDLRAHPELSEFMLPEDSGAMIRALRESYQVTLAIKEKKAAKKKKKSGPEIELDDLKGMLVDL